MMQVGINFGNGWSILVRSLAELLSQLILLIQVKIAPVVVKWSKSHYQLELTFVSVAVN